MAKILDFRNKGGDFPHPDFMTDASQTLSFHTPRDGVVSLGDMPQSLLPSLFPDPKKDWSNQELADLYRVHRLLNGANVPVETDRGITDEGDPWFVFCHATGEVFIHLCRIDGIYLLDSPNVMRPLRGADFNALIADFTNQSLPAQTPPDKTEHRVIRLERGGKIRLHPSAMLAALIWTLFLASEELVMMAPEEAADDTDALLDFDGMFAVRDTDHLVEDGLYVDTTTETASLHAKDSVHDLHHMAPEAQLHMREVALPQQGLTAHQNGFTIGLSTIAIAMGFMSEVVLMDNQRKVLETLKQLGFIDQSQDAEQTSALDITDDADGNALLAMLQNFLGIDLALDTETAEMPTHDAKASPLQQELKHLTDSVLTVNEILPLAKPTVLAELKGKNIDAEASMSAADKPAKSSDDILLAKSVETPNTETTGDTKALGIFEIVKVFQESHLEEIQLGQTTIKSSFDISEIDDFAFFGRIDATQESSSSTSLSQFDEISLRLINFFKTRDSDMGFIEQENRFIAIDRDAVREGKVDYLEWQTDDGKIISLIGHQADFLQFDMIA